MESPQETTIALSNDTIADPLQPPHRQNGAQSDVAFCQITLALAQIKMQTTATIRTQEWQESLANAK